jgi:hypothetical protein
MKSQIKQSALKNVVRFHENNILRGAFFHYFSFFNTLQLSIQYYQDYSFAGHRARYLSTLIQSGKTTLKTS